jgi:hypothetical protein
LHYATTDPVRFRECIYSLMQRLSRTGNGPIITSEELEHAREPKRGRGDAVSVHESPGS